MKKKHSSKEMKKLAKLKKKIIKNMAPEQITPDVDEIVEEIAKTCDTPAMTQCEEPSVVLKTTTDEKGNTFVEDEWNEEKFRAELWQTKRCEADTKSLLDAVKYAKEITSKKKQSLYMRLSTNKFINQTLEKLSSNTKWSKLQKIFMVSDRVCHKCGQRIGFWSFANYLEFKKTEGFRYHGCCKCYKTKKDFKESILSETKNSVLMKLLSTQINTDFGQYRNDICSMITKIELQPLDFIERNFHTLKTISEKKDE